MNPLYLRMLCFAALLLSGCKGDPLAYRKGSEHDLADRMERFADALDEKFQSEGISDDEWVLYKDVFRQYGSELSECCDRLDEQELARIAHAAGVFSGIALGETVDDAQSLLERAATLLPEYLDGMQEGLFGEQNRD